MVTVCSVKTMDSLPFGLLLTILILYISGCWTIDIRLQETYGTRDDGIVNLNAKFSIYCDVPELKIGDVVVWYKRQPEEQATVLGFNDYLMDITAGDRFKAEKFMEPDESNVLTAYVLNSIDGAHYTDSGEYGCAISQSIPGADSAEITDTQWVSLTVIEPIASLHLYSLRGEDKADPLNNVDELYDGSEYMADPGEEFYFRCVSKASNPPATVRVYFNGREITDEYEEKINRIYVGVDNKMEENFVYYQMVYDVMLTSKYPLKVSREDNRRPYTCNATVPHFEVVELSVVPVMKYYPEVQCDDTLAEYQQNEATLKCKVRSDPELTMARFLYLEENGKNQSIKLDEKAGSMQMKREQGEYGDEWIYYLQFTYVPEQSFREYTFEAANAIGQVRDTAQLIRSDTGQALSSSPNFIPSLLWVTLVTVTASFATL